MAKSACTLRFVALLAGLILSAVAVPVRAQDDNSAVLDKVTNLNKKAVDQFENLNFDQARKILQDALEACSRAGLDNSPIAARTHVHLGVVLFAGFKQKDDAVAEFKKALGIEPDIKLDKMLATPEIQEVFDEASSPSGSETSTSTSSDVITHEPVVRAARGLPIQINVTLDGSVKAKKMVLSFSADGSDGFGHREMSEASPGNWMGEIPASATQGAKVSYYLEVDGDDGQVIASKGSADAPMVVTLRGGTRAAAAAAAAKRRRRAAPPPEEAAPGPSFYLGLGIGSGFGWTTGTGDINPADKVNPAGFAAAKLGQVSPEVGYFLSPDLLLSVQLRLQVILGPSTYMGTAAPSTAVAGLARLRWLFDADDLHPFVGALLGVGSIRHVASFPSVQTCGPNGNQTCVDSIKAGPLFVGAAGGLLYNLTPGFALTAETNLAAGFSTFTFNIDVNVGIAVEF